MSSCTVRQRVGIAAAPTTPPVMCVNGFDAHSLADDLSAQFVAHILFVADLRRWCVRAQYLIGNTPTQHCSQPWINVFITEGTYSYVACACVRARL